MSLKLVSLASGSKGNATLIMSDSCAVLVDCGIPICRLKRELAGQGVSLDSLNGVVITHEHSDHIRCVQQLDAHCKIYAHPITLGAIQKICGPLYNAVSDPTYENGFVIGDILVQPFRIPHDAEYPLAYSFIIGGAKCSVATDIGVPTYGVLRNLKDSKVVLLEANHDEDMLKRGDYPLWLKRRILSDTGHLSNRSAAKIACMLSDVGELNTLILGHISENNNTLQLAFDTVNSALREKGDTKIKLALARQDACGEVYEVK